MENKIFITLGSQKFQFNRLLKAVDELCEKGTVDAEDVFAQIGYSDYLPKNFSYKKFLDRDEFSNEMEKANIVITHGGTGAIIGAVKKGKKVIAVPRLAKYGEHVDDHQLQLIKQFDDLNLISYNEGLPMAILEGMACGKAIISTTVGAIPEVINNKENGILIQPGDVKALANALVECSTNTSMVAQMSQNNIKKIDSNYSMKTMHEKLALYYEKV